MGRTVSTALTNEVKFRLEVSAKTSGTDEWVPLYEWTSSNGKTAASSTTLNGATTAGQHNDRADIWHRLHGGRLVLHPRNWHAGQQRVVARAFGIDQHGHMGRGADAQPHDRHCVYRPGRDVGDPVRCVRSGACA